jgi:hypothetical protein
LSSVVLKISLLELAGTHTGRFRDKSGFGALDRNGPYPATPKRENAPEMQERLREREKGLSRGEMR